MGDYLGWAAEVGIALVDGAFDLLLDFGRLVAHHAERVFGVAAVLDWELARGREREVSRR